MKPIELPTFEATWWPVRLETVLGSGELITLAVVVRPQQGKSQVRQVISPALIRGMFGSAGAGMQLLAGQTVIALQTQLDADTRIENLEQPFGGVSLGAPRDCVGHDINEVFEVATRQAGAFGQSLFGKQESPSQESQRAFEDWADSVREQALMLQKPLMPEAFNISVKLLPNRRTRIGFMHGGYAANFGVLRPGKATTADLRALKVKLFDLEVLRRVQAVSIHQTEVLVGCPDLGGDGPFPKRERIKLEESWEFINHEAKEREINALRYTNATLAAEHLRLIAA